MPEVALLHAIQITIYTTSWVSRSHRWHTTLGLTYRIAGYFRGVYILRISRKHSQSSKIKIVKKIINVEEAWFSISIREITFREQELNWLFAKYKRLENNPLYGNWETKKLTSTVYVT